MDAHLSRNAFIFFFTESRVVSDIPALLFFVGAALLSAAATAAATAACAARMRSRSACERSSRCTTLAPSRTRRSSIATSSRARTYAL